MAGGLHPSSSPAVSYLSQRLADQELRSFAGRAAHARVEIQVLLQVAMPSGAAGRQTWAVSSGQSYRYSIQTTAWRVTMEWKHSRG